MPNPNGHGPKRVILYARVSTDEQARSGYSLAQQLEALREYATREGYEVLEEVQDPGQSGASLERPGMDHMRDLVAAGGVSVVLALDRDRFAREPAYHYLLRREFEEHGTKVRALNDRGDESPEGELTDGILDQLAKYERAKTAERTRRGKLRKARQGKIVAGRRPNFGFRFNNARDGYEVDQENMRVVRGIFEMAAEGTSVHGIKRALDQQGIPTPSGRPYWHWRAIHSFIMDDVYKPHSYQEVKELISPEVAERLESGKHYGIWWYNRQRVVRKQIAESGPNGRTYRKRGKYSIKDRCEWIAVPVPDAGIPQEVVEAARQTVLDYRPTSKVAGRFWELSGAIMRCALCGRAMNPQKTGYTKRSGEKGHVLYYRCPRAYGYDGECSHRKNHRADNLEPSVWNLVSDLLSNPGRLRAGLEQMIEEERGRIHGNPERETKVWLDELAEVDHRRSSFQDMAAEGLISFDELRTKLASLEETRQLARRELDLLQERRERLQDLEQDKNTLLEHYAGMIPGALNDLAPEERHHVYKMLRLRILVHPDGILEVSGTYGNVLELSEYGPTPASGVS
ncbi:MAG: recombinase family protein, partial [Pyrinomonadaceae bacterium]|nr:recombinase family protein [Pyrinomonadaceae bacterium]